MKKKDLKSKMFVKLRNGDLYLVVEDVIVKENSFLLLEYYSEDLLDVDDDDSDDIVEVFKISNPYFKFKDDLGMMSLSFKKIELDNYFESLWKREDVLDDEQIV
jgi:hypothetical protein